LENLCSIKDLDKRGSMNNSPLKTALSAGVVAWAFRGVYADFQKKKGKNGTLSDAHFQPARDGNQHGGGVGREKDEKQQQGKKKREILSTPKTSGGGGEL